MRRISHKWPLPSWTSFSTRQPKQMKAEASSTRALTRPKRDHRKCEFVAAWLIFFVYFHFAPCHNEINL